MSEGTKLLIILMIIVSAFALTIFMIHLSQAIPRKREAKKRKTEELEKLMAKMNTLYNCNICSRYFRNWQYVIHKKIHEEEVCIHCGNDRSRGYFNKVEVEEGHWTNTNSDCPIISPEEWREQEAILQKHAIAKKEARLAEEEMEYEKKRKESYWITKLKK